MRTGILGVFGVFGVSALVALSAACSSESSAPAPASVDGGAVTEASTEEAGALLTQDDADAFCAKTYAVFKTYLGVCCTANDVATEEYALIASVFDSIGEDCSATLGRSAGKARIAFDEAAANACAAAFKPLGTQKGCTAGLGSANVGEVCRPAIVGRQAEGAPCSLDYECVDGLWCKGPTNTADGSCEKPVAVGGTCTTTGPATKVRVRSFGTHPHCEDGAYCPTAGGACTKLKKAGSACTDKTECVGGHCYLGKCDTKSAEPEGSPCLTDGDCGKRLYCKSAGAGATGTCTPNRLSPESCSQNDECLGRCVLGDGGAGTCAPFCGAG